MESGTQTIAKTVPAAKVRHSRLVRKDTRVALERELDAYLEGVRKANRSTFRLRLTAAVIA